MTMFFAAMLASAQPLPFIDLASLDARSKIESLQQSTPAKRREGTARSLLALDVQTIATVCSAAGKLADPVEFLGELGDAYAMTRGEVAALRQTCAVYLSGRLDAQPAALIRR